MKNSKRLELVYCLFGREMMEVLSKNETDRIKARSPLVTMAAGNSDLDRSELSRIEQRMLETDHANHDRLARLVRKLNSFLVDESLSTDTWEEYDTRFR